MPPTRRKRPPKLPKAVDARGMIGEMYIALPVKKTAAERKAEQRERAKAAARLRRANLFMLLLRLPAFTVEEADDFLMWARCNRSPALREYKGPHNEWPGRCENIIREFYKEGLLHRALVYEDTVPDKFNPNANKTVTHYVYWWVD